MGEYMSNVISVRGLKKVYRVGDERVTALAGVDLDVEDGEMLCVFGPSGSGKSTLLNQLAGFEPPSAGSVRVAGVDLPGLTEKQMASFRREHIGFIFQSYDLIPYMTAVENVALPLTFKGVDEKTRSDRAVAMLRRVGLGDRLRHYPTQMSGGQQQRVGIARAFAAKPEVIFADEPTGNLDTATSAQIISMITELAGENNETIVLVTHNPELAAQCDRIITLTDGRIVREEKGSRKR